MRRFHSYGPINARHHFCVARRELVDRCVNQLIGDPEEGGHYFTIWAARQTGKTWLMRQVEQEILARYGDQFAVHLLSLGDLRGFDYLSPTHEDQGNIGIPEILSGIFEDYQNTPQESQSIAICGIMRERSVLEQKEISHGLLSPSPDSRIGR